MFNTGTVVGVSANIYGNGFPPKFVPSFHGVAQKGLKRTDLKKKLLKLVKECMKEGI